MTASVIQRDGGLELVVGGVRAVVDDLTLTAWGERHRLALGGLAPGPNSDSQSHDELGPHELLSFGFATRSVRNPVSFKLVARCYELEPVLLLELVPGFDQPILGTEECASLRLGALPDCRRAVYLHQRVNEYGRDAVGSWWAQALCLADPTRGNPWDWGLGLVWQAGERCAALLPMRAGGAVSRLRGEGEGLSLVASGWCGRHRYPRLPLGLLAVDDTPAAALERGYRAVSALCEWSFRRREDKPVPEAFEYLGYSTWAGHGRNVTQGGVVEAVSSLREQGVPIRWVWLEEGWQQVNRHQQLGGWGAEPQRFPGGLEATVRELQGRGGVRHVGVWLALQGGWGGVDPASALGARPERLYAGLDGSTVPDPGPPGESFWYDGLRALRDAGVDMVRVDNQGSGRNLYLGRLAIDEAVGGAVANVERAATSTGLELAAGMSHHPECLYHYALTNVVRAAADIVPADRRAAKLHLAHAARVGAWLGRIAWPDCDGVPSTHPAALAFAVVSALSGGPIYLADPPGEHDLALLACLAFADGRVPLVEAPAEPPASRFFDDPLHGAAPLVLAAPAARVPRRDPPVGLNEWRPQPQAVYVALLNVTLAGDTVRAALRLAELELPAAERYAVSAWSGGWRRVMTAGEELALDLAELETELLTIAPIEDGRAILGRRDKLLGASGCLWEVDDVLSLPEPGPVLLYDETGRIPTSADYEPYRLVAEERPLGAGEARRDGPWLLVQATSTVLRMERRR